MSNLTESALVKRINRRLYPQDEVLRKSRGERARWEVGEFYVIDFRINCLVRPDVDLIALGRELGVLREHETVS